MFSFLMPASSDQGRQTSGEDECVLSFDPEKVVQGIRFHLLDAKVARSVASQSCADCLARLSRRSDPLTIRRDQWASMGDTERLKWLLDHSRTRVRFCPDGVAVLLGKL